MTEVGTPAWRVRIPAHRIPRRSIAGVALEHDPYEISESETVSYELTRPEAIHWAVESAHARAGIPPWKPYMRQTARLVTVESITVSALTGITPRGGSDDTRSQAPTSQGADQGTRDQS